jgi:hypothetical protein
MTDVPNADPAAGPGKRKAKRARTRRTREIPGELHPTPKPPPRKRTAKRGRANGAAAGNGEDHGPDHGPPHGTPLYGVDRLLAADADSYVIVVRHEQDCAAAERLFGAGFVVTAVMAGASFSTTDWSPIVKFDHITWWGDEADSTDFRKVLPIAGWLDFGQLGAGFSPAELEQMVAAGEVDDAAAWFFERLRGREEVIPDQPGTVPNGEGPPPHLDDRPPEGDDGPAPDPKPLPSSAFIPEQALAYFNARYLVVNDGGSALIYEPRRDETMQDRRYFVRIKPVDFRVLYANRSVHVGQDEEGFPIYKKAATWWLDHHKRRQYLGGLRFAPGRVIRDPEVLNLWEGFAVGPKLGEWGKLRSHLLHVVCSGNRDHAAYLLNWMARLVQRPGEHGQVCIVLIGLEGCGKSLIGQVLCRILGQHSLAISAPEHLVGRFNLHLRDCCFLLADEVSANANKKQAGALRALITEPTLTIEGKFQNASQSPNYLHVLMTANPGWVIPASMEARRFCAFDVSPRYIGDHGYFDAMWKELEAGGLEALLHDLLARDISGFNVRNFPKTAALNDQKKLSLEAFASWWADVLDRGYVFNSKYGFGRLFTTWFETISMDLLHAAYSEYHRQHRTQDRRLSREKLGEFFTSIGAQHTQPRNVIIGEERSDQPDDGSLIPLSRPTARLIRADRARAYRFGDLKTARAAFTGKTGLEVDWGPDEDLDASVTP